MKVLTPCFTLPDGYEWVVVVPDNWHRTDETRRPAVVDMLIGVTTDSWDGWRVFSKHGSDMDAAQEMKSTLTAVQEIHNS